MEGGLDFYQILLDSGIVVKFVLLILIACSVLSWAVIFQKRKEFNEINASNEKFLTFFYSNTNLVEIQKQATSHPDSSVGMMYNIGFDELVKIKSKLTENDKSAEVGNYFNEHGVQALERSLRKGATMAAEILERRLSLLASISSNAVFIGLFGTVWGIIDSFTGLAHGGGSIEAVAPGIAEALVATAVGLMAAIPAGVAYNVFYTKISVIQGQMDSFGQDFLNLIERNVLIKKDI